MEFNLNFYDKKPQKPLQTNFEEKFHEFSIIMTVYSEVINVIKCPAVGSRSVKTRHHGPEIGFSCIFGPWFKIRL
jgi:hypothetical protein